jgi:rhodanese-related sulfurtransferase
MPTLQKEIKPEEKVIFICRTGNRTLQAASYVSKELHYSQVYNVQGGITEWIRNGFPVEKI